MQARGESVAYQVGRFVALMLLFALLNYTGSALYHTTGGHHHRQAFSGVALALLLINGRSWLWPVLVSGTIGAIFAKLVFGNIAFTTISFLSSHPAPYFWSIICAKAGSDRRSIFAPGNS